MVHWAVAPGWRTETVEWLSDGHAIRGFLASSTRAQARTPAVLLLHEWWGLTEHMKDVARRLAGEGYIVLAPDLYSRQGGKTAGSVEEATALMNGLSSQRALRDLNAAVAFLKTRPFVDALRLGVLGFSMGGTFALNQIGHNSDLKAAVVFYGKVPPSETFRYVLCPVQFHHAAKDQWVTPQEVERLQQGLRDSGKPVEIHTYPDADHAFLNDTRPEVYRAEDAKRAWERTVAFFNRHLSW